MPRILILILMMTLLGWVGAGTAQALVVGGGIDLHNVPLTSAQDAWNSVGALSNGSGVYLGQGWVLTANHVYSQVVGQHINLNGMGYDEQVGYAVRLKNPDSSLADLVMFQIEGDPGLGMLPLRTDSPASGTHTMLIGVGRTQQQSPTYWNVIDL